MARLLYIGSGNPWLGGAGFLVRQSLFLGALREVADLHLAMFDCDPKTPGDFGRQLTVLSKPRKASASKIRNLIQDWCSSQPRMIRGYDLSEPRKQVAALNPSGFDAVFAFRIDFAHFAGVMNHPNLLLDIDDPEHIRGQRRLATQGGGDARTVRDLQKLRVFEHQAVAKAKLAFVCQENDRHGWDKPPDVVPNCVQVPANPQRRVTRPIVLFVGNCAGGPASPNGDAVKFFLSDIWPKIAVAVPTAEFHLVGSASDFVKQLVNGSPRVKLRGFVDDLAEVYAEAALSVAPIRFGTGTRIKILESFAHACPVVATLPGAEGIAAVPGREIELSAGADDFAYRVISLLRDGVLAEQIGRGGHALAQRQFDVIAQQRLLVPRLKQFVRERAAG